ncbi:hypothetical protein [Curtobacterium herbarum]|uniref:Transposase n=1 Tax=Curtobacterium herbarum TaxID=150122 RepID=A0ABN1Z8Y5_9MICO|nr:hypothetical protein [Curtobacterium herbarum]MBM7476312.1 hypothetical protein [Curtobacterium herbarum]MCS6544121.1 hypothetical protein [Curtobacterium herbarum]
MDIDTLAAAARELLLVVPTDFVAERTVRQRAVRTDDRETAAAIGKLRKPAPAAWVVDLLANEQALDEAVDLGPSLRAAQANADPQEISVLRRQRTSVVRALVQAGADLADDAGHPVTPAVLQQVRATIEAAMADPHAGAAVRSGLLVQPLESVGFEDVDLDGALAVPDAVPDAWSGSDAPPIPITAGRRGARRSRSSGPVGTRDRDPADPADTRTDAAGPGRASRPAAPAERDPAAPAQRDPAAERRAARDAERQARQASRDADAALDGAESALEDVAARRTDLERRRQDLERQLRELGGDRADLDAEAERLGHERDDAEQASDRARADLVAARRRRHDLD